MKKIFSALAVLALLSGCTSICKSTSCPEPEVPARTKAAVTISQKSKYQIIYPDLPANAPRIAIYTEAANMLKQALYEGVGISAPIRMESKALKGYKNIYLGDTKAARAAGIKVEDHPNFGFIIKYNSVIFIFKAVICSYNRIFATFTFYNLPAKRRNIFCIIAFSLI